MKAIRQLNGWQDRLPAWRYALTLGTFYFVFLVIVGVPLQWWAAGHVNLAFLLPYAAIFAVVMTSTLTFARQRRRRQATRTTDHRPPPEP